MSASCTVSEAEEDFIIEMVDSYWWVMWVGRVEVEGLIV